MWSLKISVAALLIVTLFCESNGSGETSTKPSATKWKDGMDKAAWIRNGVTGDVMSMVLSQVHVFNISAPCKKSMIEFAKDHQEWKPWAIKMVDASAKFPAAVLDGTSMQPGAFDQCLSLEGRHCLVGVSSPLVEATRDTMEARLEKMGLASYQHRHGQPPQWISEYLFEKADLVTNGTIWLGMCLPATCSEPDIHSIFTTISAPRGLGVRISDCQAEEDVPLSFPAKVSLYGILCVLILNLIGTCLDVLRNRSGLPEESLKDEGGVLRTFSVVRNHKLLCDDVSKHASLDAIHGFRALYGFAIVGGHMYMYPDKWHSIRLGHYLRSDNFLVGWERIAYYDTGSLLISNFFLVSGFLLTYSTWKKFEKNGGYLNLWIFFLRRHLRTIPVFLLAVAVMFLVPQLRRGPTWLSIWEEHLVSCREGIWRNILPVGNFFHYREQCLLQSWFLSCLMQCQMTGAVLLIIVYKSKKTGLALGALLVAGCSGYVFQKAWSEGRRTPSTTTSNDLQDYDDFMVQYYFRPFIHMSSYCVGMVAGYIVLKRDRSYTLPKIFQLLAWIISLTFIYVALALHYLFSYNGLDVVLYVTFHGMIYSIGKAWIIYACTTGIGGSLNKFLSSTLMGFLGRLNFGICLFHPLVYIFKKGAVMERSYLQHYDHILDLFSVYMVSCFLSYFAYVLVEMPFSELQERWMPSETEPPHEPPCPQQGVFREKIKNVD